MITSLIVAALAAFAPVPGPQPGYLDLSKVVSITEYDSSSLLLAVKKDTFYVVRKDLIEYRAGSISVPTSSVMMMVVGDTPPIVLSAEWRGADDNILYRIVLNCATYTSFTACQDAFDAAVASTKKAHKPAPAVLTGVVPDK